MAIEHAIRQAILRDLKLYTGAPITARELVQISQEPAIRHADEAAVLEEFVELHELGYIEAVPGYRGKYCQISDKGRQQLLDDFPQDPFVWGPGAK
jgi:hypothetical protein